MSELPVLRLLLHSVKARWVAAQLGAQPASVSRWATGKTQPSARKVEQLAQLLGVPAHILMAPITIELEASK